MLFSLLLGLVGLAAAVDQPNGTSSSTVYITARGNSPTAPGKLSYSKYTFVNRVLMFQNLQL